ncbi:MAG: aminopeptidase, partial [Bacteroidales bacterium]|nr:aminopeptidase [Bacteroidales bacterium]
MNKKLSIVMLCVFCTAWSVGRAQNAGGISESMLANLKKSYTNSPQDKAIRNALNTADINKLAVNSENATAFDSHFSNQVNVKAITNQKSSGRCWMFTGMNVLRSKAIRANHLPADFQFSQVYTFFYDQLEKSNLFLQAILDTRKLAIDDQQVQWLFKNPIGDGGQFTGVANLIDKYGVVPAEVMPETRSSNATSQMSNLIALKLREYGLELRDMSAQKGMTEAKLQARKAEMLQTVYRMLALNFGVPPEKFIWTQRDAKGNAVSTKEYTPKSFAEAFVKEDFSTYYMFMNDPTR